MKKPFQYSHKPYPLCKSQCSPKNSNFSSHNSLPHLGTRNMGYWLFVGKQLATVKLINMFNRLIGLLAYEEGWQSTHHAFELSVRHGLEWWAD
ncbi:hypothetical protein DVH24_028119 [Malus domestica]|uniref:Uncharacterized protein n=1 Tax=Malus domestica TaxID=3750 RepID=A0A498HDL4_MALDO|nr:hypothetical protein DVH24_028119 [Malus domestica]